MKKKRCLFHKKIKFGFDFIFEGEIFIYSKMLTINSKGVKKPIKNVRDEIFLSPLKKLKIAEIDDIQENLKIFTPPPR